MLRNIDIFVAYIKNIHDGIIIPQEICTAAGGYEK